MDSMGATVNESLVEAEHAWILPGSQLEATQTDPQRKWKTIAARPIRSKDSFIRSTGNTKVAKIPVSASPPDTRIHRQNLRFEYAKRVEFSVRTGQKCDRSARKSLLHSVAYQNRNKISLLYRTFEKSQPQCPQVCKKSSLLVTPENIRTVASKNATANPAENKRQQNYKWTQYSVVYLTFKLLWNLARETFAPVWSPSKFFTSRNLVLE